MSNTTANIDEVPVIGMVLPYLKSRGTEKQALKLAEGFIAKGARVVLFVVQGWGLDNMYQAFRDAGVKVVNAGTPEKTGQKKVDFPRVFALAILARKYHCDILLSRAGLSNQICGWAGFLSFIPTILVLSGPALPKQNINSPIGKIFSFILIGKRYGFPNRVVSISEKGAANFKSCYPLWSKQVKAILNGVQIIDEELDGESPLKLDDKKFYVCFSGSLELERKGMDLLLEALKYLVFDYGLNKTCLVLIGTGQDESKIRDWVQSHGLMNHVIFAGEQVNPYPVMKKCDVFVLPSRREGLGNSLLEAMALGICCIATDCNSGPGEIIENGQNGILVETGKSRVLADAIARVGNDPDLRNRLARGGQKTIAEKFSYQSMIDKYYTLITEIK